MTLRLTLILTALLATACGNKAAPVATERGLATPEQLSFHCKEHIGPARVEQIADNLWLAIGYDLGNTILLHTSEGNVVIDTMLSPGRARAAKAALLAKAPGPTRAVIYTHSHIDHVGGAAEWIEQGTEIWATDRFMGHFLKQYGAFLPAERARGARQFGRSVADADVPCSALGKRLDYADDMGMGFRPPTRTFTGKASFELGGVRVELVEAHGETDDQLFVWLPALKALMPGDNYYAAFPNLYTVRGTRPRPVSTWIESLDNMRRLQPELLVPSHTIPLRGADTIQSALRDYRDGIQWVRDEVVRAANRGDRLATIADRAALPAHLAKIPALRELYGQVDWSARAIFTNELGWFDGSAADLYRPPDADLAREEVALAGGPSKLREKAKQALKDGKPRFAVHWLSRLRASGLAQEQQAALKQELAESLRATAAGVTNTNGRAYLLNAAAELDGSAVENKPPVLSDALIDALPVDSFIRQMPGRLRPQDCGDVHETLQVVITEPPGRYLITVRRGIAELAVGEPLPGTPSPIGTITTDADTWKRVALGLTGTAAAVAQGKISLDGDVLAVQRFTDRFDRGL